MAVSCSRDEDQQLVSSVDGRPHRVPVDCDKYPTVRLSIHHVRAAASVVSLGQQYVSPAATIG
jgi:hypothetical protein